MDDAIPVLIIDDDQKYCRLVRDYLEPLGFAVSMAHDGPQGLGMLHSGGYAALILDVMLPGVDGFELLRRIRAGNGPAAAIPVLMLTARGDETDRIVGLEMGADDYVPKTFSHRELLARLRAVTRRARPATVGSGEPEHISVGGLHIDTGGCAVTLNGQTVELTRLEYDMLLALARANGRVLNRDQLLDAVDAGRSHESYDRSVDMHISALRKKLGDDPRTPVYIKTVRGMGYKLLGPPPEGKR